MKYYSKQRELNEYAYAKEAWQIEQNRFAGEIAQEKSKILKFYIK